MCTGSKRPDWTRTGEPSAAELGDIRFWRERVLAGFPSLATATQVSDLGLEMMDDLREGLELLRMLVASKGMKPPNRTPRPRRLTDVAEEADTGIRPPGIPAPPGMAQDDPLILSGVYEWRG